MLFRRKVLNGEDYEQYVADLLRHQGFQDIQFTAKTGDYGVDLLATRGRHRYAIQCKYYTGSVGGFAVQEAVAGMAYYGCERAMVVTNSVLTKNAHALAEANGVEILEEIDPDRLSFLERLEPWQLVVFAIQLVGFGLLLFRIIEVGNFTWKNCLELWVYCFPLPWIVFYVLRAIRLRSRRDMDDEEDDLEE